MFEVGSRKQDYGLGTADYGLKGRIKDYEKRLTLTPLPLNP